GFGSPVAFNAQPADIEGFRAASLCWPSHLPSGAALVLRAARTDDSRLPDADTRGPRESARTASLRRSPPPVPRSAFDCPAAPSPETASAWNNPPACFRWLSHRCPYPP